MKKEMTKKRRTVIISVWTAVAVVILALFIFLTCYANSWSKALGPYFGYVGGTAISTEELNEEQKETTLKVVDEGVVLLQNDNNALPLAEDSNVSVFGQTAEMWRTRDKITNTVDTTLLTSLQDAGLNVNGSLRRFYKQYAHTDWGTGANYGDGGIAGDWTIDEVPQSEYEEADVADSYEDFSDAAIVVFSRTSSEGGDLPRYMGRYGGSDSESYLELNSDEKDLLQAIKDSGVFKKTIVILHSGNPFQMDFLKEDYGVDAVLWIAGTGPDGVEEIGKILTGEVNPSGKNVDTYCYDNFSSPVMQNFGDYRFTKDGSLIDDTTSTVGGTYSYINYGEGIYTGYKYYETRYEDYVLGRDNVGTYDYANTVYRPFGYGESYTTFEWSNFNMTQPDSDGNVTVTVDVKNTGSVAGKDVVELYLHSPYTEYDQQYGVEKASASLLDFEKTELLDAGASQTITFTENLEDMVSYDETNAKTYILDASEQNNYYYLTVATDAHQAVNNILASETLTTEQQSRMVGTGDSSLVGQFEITELKKYDKSSTGYTVTNELQSAVLSDATYLSRSNWSVLDTYNKDTMQGGIAYTDGTMDLGTSASNGNGTQTMNSKGTVGVHAASEAIYNGLKSTGWDASGNPVGIDDESWPAVSYNSTATSYTLDDFMSEDEDGNITYVDYDSTMWDDIVNQLSQSVQVNLVGCAGWGTAAVSSINKPETYYLDGPQGMQDYISGENGYEFPNECMLGATWNKQLAYEMGDMISQEFAMKGASIWWSPAMNIHRSPFSGRSFEYFSEDGMHSGLMGLQETLASNANNVVLQLKHFFMNDQETNRGVNGRVATFGTEQAMREIYLKPFQICVEEGGANGVMSTMCRIGTTIMPASYAVNTEILRNEWGMKGAVITDAQSFTEDEAEEALAGGCDMVDITSPTSYSSSTLNSRGGQYMLHVATKNILYVTVNSVAFGSDFTKGFPIYILLLIAIWVVVVLYLAYGTAEILMKAFPNQKIMGKRGKWIMRIIMWVLAAAIIATVLGLFFGVWYEDLMFALQTI